LITTARFRRLFAANATTYLLQFATIRSAFALYCLSFIH